MKKDIIIPKNKNIGPAIIFSLMFLINDQYLRITHKLKGGRKDRII
jgi:hypothetical protein